MMNRNKPFVAVILLIFFALFLRTAWVGDDVFISLRTLDNAVNGYGLRWNVGERVQSYTHPLWMLAMLPVYAVTRWGYFTALFVSFVFSLATLAIIGFSFAKSLPHAILGFSMLISAKSFVDYSVSGLENPMSHFLTVLFLYLFLHEENTGDSKGPNIFLLGSLVSLSMLNRMDTALLYFPALVYLFIQKRTWKARLVLFLAFAPFFLWEAFSLVYYGFPFPNTAYAKLNTGIPRDALILQGLDYYRDSFSRDPITLITIAASFVLVFLKGSIKEYLLVAGIVLYLIYIINIGGDFMSGRFFSTPLVIGVLLLMYMLEAYPVKIQAAVSIIGILLGFLAPYPTLHVKLTQPLYTEQEFTSITDERAFYYPFSGLLVQGKPGTISANSGWVERGNVLRERGKIVVEERNVGYIGYFAGPRVHILDRFALNDPLLSKLPIPNPDQWRIGHFERSIPDGYLETLKSGRNRIKDSDLATYYDQLYLIVRGPLWSLERMCAIWKMNTGQFDFLLHEYTR